MEFLIEVLLGGLLELVADVILNPYQFARRRRDRSRRVHKGYDDRDRSVAQLRVWTFVLTMAVIGGAGFYWGWRVASTGQTELPLTLWSSLTLAAISLIAWALGARTPASWARLKPTAFARLVCFDPDRFARICVISLIAAASIVIGFETA